MIPSAVFVSHTLPFTSFGPQQIFEASSKIEVFKIPNNAALPDTLVPAQLPTFSLSNSVNSSTVHSA